MSFSGRFGNALRTDVLRQSENILNFFFTAVLSGWNCIAAEPGGGGGGRLCARRSRRCCSCGSGRSGDPVLDGWAVTDRVVVADDVLECDPVDLPDFRLDSCEARAVSSLFSWSIPWLS